MQWILENRAFKHFLAQTLLIVEKFMELNQICNFNCLVCVLKCVLVYFELAHLLTAHKVYVKFKKKSVVINTADKKATLRVLIKLCNYSEQSSTDEQE